MKKSELRQLIREEIKIIRSDKTDKNKKVNEENIPKHLEKSTTDYKNLLLKKQQMIDDIKKVLATETDPDKRKTAITKHNAAAKKLNKQIDNAERAFTISVDKIEAEDTSEL